jgi:flagellar biosynthesis chaperone FliJ
MAAALTIKYPLTQLKRLREFELEEASAVLQKCAEEAALLRERILACDHGIARISADLARKEIETGNVYPELRRNVALCIKAQEMERLEHEQHLVRAEALREAAYARLLESKQASKMIERHEERHRSAFFVDDIRRRSNEADDLYLARVKASS